MCASNHWTYARSPTTVWNAESLMKIEVRNICAKLSRLSKTNKCIEVCSIDIDLTTCIVNCFADL